MASVADTAPQTPTSVEPGRPRAAAVWLLLSFIASLLAVVVWRALLVDQSVGAYTGCHGCLLSASIAHDARWLLPVPLLAMLLWRWRGARPLVWLLGLDVGLVYVADLVLFRVLNYRLLWNEVLKFAGESRAVTQVLSDVVKDSNGRWLLGLCLLFLGTLVLLPKVSLGPLGTRRLGWLLGALIVVAWLWPEPHYFYQEAFANVFEVNRPNPADRLYGEDFKKQIASRALPPQQCTPGLGQVRDVIVLAVESLSAYHSRLLSGIMDAAPRLDALMQQHSYFPDFVANGFSTDGGLIALFAGRVPIPAQQRFRSQQAFVGFETPTMSFYQRLHALGYESAFLMTADRDFLHAGRWLEALGFDTIEGAEGAFYRGWQRGQFGAAEDRALYQRVLQWLDQRDPQRPLFMGLLTTTSHPPFAHPHTGKLDELASLRYVDQTIQELVDGLTARHFFANGVLLITGDHRSMTPLKAAEWQADGERAFSRVPLVVIGASGLPSGAIRGRFQQTDLIPSLLHLIDGETCRTGQQGILLGSTPQPARYRVYANSYRRDLVYFVSAAGSSELHLRGDESYQSGPTSPELTLLVAALHRDRIERGPLPADLVELMLPGH